MANRDRVVRVDRVVGLVGPLLGVIVMLAGLAILLFRHDGTQGYSLLGIGAVVFGTSGVGSRKRCWPL